MKIHYHPDTNSLTIHLKDGPKGIMGEDLNESISCTVMTTVCPTRSESTETQAECST